MLPPIVIRLRGGRVIDPANKIDTVTDLWIEGGVIAALGDFGNREADETFDCTGKIVAPGLIDSMFTCANPAERKMKQSPQAWHPPLPGE